MKRLIYKIWTFFLVGLLVSCADDDIVWKDAGGGAIKLRFTDGLLLSRAADTEVERAISHLDVFIFESNGTNPIYERINNPAVSGEDSQGTVTLMAQLSEFEGRSSNLVYVVANAKEDLSIVQSLSELQQKVQTDERIHVTGTSADGAPQYFLMDGQASATENGTPDAITINAQASEDVTLYVTLKRAAAKVVVTLSQGTGQYKFLQDATQNYEMGYYFRNMPYKTTLLSGLNNPYPSDTYWRMPDKANDSAFEWCKDNQNQVVVTAYVYSHYWDNSENNTYHVRGTSLVVNIPLWYDANNDNAIDEGEEVYMNSYYQIPIVNSQTENNQTIWRIDRNTLYTVTATIEAPGAEDNKQPHELKNLSYHTQAWQDVTVNVGATTNPVYLEVNKNLLEMHNVATDNTLEFTSSSTIKSVTVSNAYYYNKYGTKIDITDHSSNGMSAVFDNTTLTGTITVNSEVPENLTARYFTIEVTNQDNLTETIKVIQYPVISVSNQLGWYSYREDFNFNWESTNQNNARVSVGANDNGGNYTTNFYGTSASNSSGRTTYFFNSKVIEEIENSNRNDAKHTSYFYNGSKRTSVCEESNNMRMYQMQVMATSAEYVVGRPRLNSNGYTDRSVENNKLVSPSFMIASRLGAVYSEYGNTDGLSDGGNGGLTYNDKTGVFTTSNYNIDNDELLKFYEDHCKNYVEVVGTANNKKVYKDWRLPTSAEIIFIINNQGSENQNADAIDYLLNGTYYYSANGPVHNSKNNQNGKAIRCVHDVYDPSLVIDKKE